MRPNMIVALSVLLTGCEIHYNSAPANAPVAPAPQATPAAVSRPEADSRAALTRMESAGAGFEPPSERRPEVGIHIDASAGTRVNWPAGTSACPKPSSTAAAAAPPAAARAKAGESTHAGATLAANAKAAK